MRRRMKKTTKVRGEVEISDIFDLSFVREARAELKASGWKPSFEV